jgi:hypothetical protein
LRHERGEGVKLFRPADEGGHDTNRVEPRR